jgi:dinuclear metal center YbgI/SA1388 family protein
MTVKDIQDIIERWAPKAIAWEKDNVGLQVGDPATRVSGILVALDATERTIAETKQRRANLLVSHHPLLFKPIYSVTPGNETGRCVQSLIRERVALYSAHTNLDFTRGGTSFALADALGLRRVDFLLRSYQIQKKIVTFVPRDHVESVMRAMAEEGAGSIGNYAYCSFKTEGKGTFKGNEASKPAAGNRGLLEEVSEVRLEMVAREWDITRIIDALKRAHPYEEVAYDVLPTENVSGEYGMGIVGELDRPMDLGAFLSLVKKSLGTHALRHTGGVGRKVRRVAACGGSGSDLTDHAISQGCDAFITADVKYHSFHHAAGRIILVDAGHFETELPVVHAVAQRLKQELLRSRARVPVFEARTSTNPIVYV